MTKKAISASISKSLNLNPPKGFRDFLPQEAGWRTWLINKITSVLERYGFEPLETPALEYSQILEGKYGEEERLIFKFEDRGGRNLALRYDQTVPLARVIAKYQDKLPFPFKRYQIQPSWRAEKPQSGRYREFLQCDFDIIGSSSPLADAEILAVTNAVLQNLGFKNFLILINDRRVLSRIIQTSGIRKSLELKTIRILDKLEKIGEANVTSELEKIGTPQTKIETLMFLLGKRPLLPGKKKPEVALDEIDLVTAKLKDLAIPSANVLYTPTLARGLDYYTGITIEPIIQDYEAGSVGGGGRYDNLIGCFSDKKIPAVGLSFGVDRLLEAMQKQNLLPAKICPTRVLISVFSPDLLANSVILATSLRQQLINSEFYLEAEEKLKKQFKYADKKGIPYVVIIGPDELENNNYTLRDMRTGNQESLTLEKLIEILKAS